MQIIESLINLKSTRKLSSGSYFYLWICVFVLDIFFDHDIKIYTMFEVVGTKVQETI